MSDSENNKEVTIYDIAEALNVSPSTVSRSLKNHSSISSDTQQRVKEQAQKMGYRSNIFAKNLRRKKTNTLGVIVPKLNSNFMSSVIAGMEKVANDNGYNLIISQSLETAEKEASNVKTMFESRVDGLIVSLAYDTSDYSHFDQIIDNNIPLVFFDRVAYYKSAANIIIDNFKAGHQAVTHMLEQGCKHIVHMTSNLARNVYEDRFRGYKKALEDYDIPFEPDYLIQNDLSNKAGQAAAQQILEMNPLPDGLFVANDTCAIACMSTLKERGINIPDDIAVVGFNNDPISSFVNPKLTTINYHGNEMGKVVVRNLISHLDGDNNISVTNTIILNAELTIRESSLRTSQ
jgi:LacI family transcriptional regulator